MSSTFSTKALPSSRTLRRVCSPILLCCLLPEHHQGLISTSTLFSQAYTGLKTLYLECNAIADIEGLDALVNLRCVYLGKNMIHQITGLDSLTQLETLDLSENDIRRVEGLEHLTNLKFLSLSGVQSSDITYSSSATGLARASIQMLGLHEVWSLIGPCK